MSKVFGFDFGKDIIDSIIDKISRSKTLQKKLFDKLSQTFAERGVKSLVYDATKITQHLEENDDQVLAKFKITEYPYSIEEEYAKLHEQNKKLIKYIQENRKYIEYGRRHFINSPEGNGRLLGAGAPTSDQQSAGA